MGQMQTVLPVELNQPLLNDLPVETDFKAFATDGLENVHDYLSDQQSTIKQMWADLVQQITKYSHLTGQLTIAGSLTSAAILLNPAQPDSNYRVFVTPVGFTGSPATGSSQVVLVAKTKAMFVVNVAAAPGVSNSVIFDWVLLR